jgi:hypothetical protein
MINRLLTSTFSTCLDEQVGASMTLESWLIEPTSMRSVRIMAYSVHAFGLGAFGSIGLAWSRKFDSAIN